MAKKVKYYGVFVKRTIENELPKELIEMLSKHGEIAGLKKSIVKVFVFDNELAQVDCLVNIEGAVVASIDATDKVDFLAQVDELKQEHDGDNELPMQSNDCNAMVPASQSHGFPD